MEIGTQRETALRHIRPEDIKTCYTTDNQDFTADCRNALGYEHITFEGCLEENGFMLFAKDDHIQSILDNNTLLYQRLAEYYGVEQITSIHCDNMAYPLVWICFRDRK